MVNEIVILGMLLCGLALLLKLKWWSALAIAAILGLTYWRMKKAKKLQGQAEEKLYDTTNYLENVLPAFAREGKIDRALEAVADALPEAEMKKRLEKALLHAGNGYEACLGVVESDFNCSYVRRVHQFLLHAELYGGDMVSQVGLLLHACRQWKNRCYTSMKERKNEYRNVVLSIASSLLICGMIVNMPFVQLELADSNWVQAVSVVVVLLDCLILLRGKKFLQADWTKLGEKEGRNYMEEMDRYYSYDPKKEIRLSLIFGLPLFALTAVFLYFGKYWLAFFTACLGLVFLQQHRIGHALLKKRLEKQLRRDFPSWLLDLSLLLQGDNVQTAIEKSIAHAPDSLQGDLKQLQARLAITPESYEPYSLFLQEFQIPEINASMRMLYAMSLGNQAMEDKSLEELVASNDAMQDLAEREWMKDQNSGLYALFLAPLLTASLHLVCDMAVFMLLFLQTASV